MAKLKRTRPRGEGKGHLWLEGVAFRVTAFIVWLLLSAGSVENVDFAQKTRPPHGPGVKAEFSFDTPFQPGQH